VTQTSYSKKQSPKFRVGDLVSVAYGSRRITAEIVEDRGQLGIHGRRLYRVRPGEDDSTSFEIPEDDLEIGNAAAIAARSATELTTRLGVLLKHISDPVRIQIIMVLTEGDRDLAAISEVLGIDRSSISHHLALLRHGGMIAPRQELKRKTYALTEVGKNLAKVVRDLGE
jgi:ArsR family transcriptional regulator, zinc-responsive transcriptional repressor